MHVLRVRYHKRCPHIDEFLTSKHLSRWIRTFARTIGVRAWISKPCLPLHLITYSFFSLFLLFFFFFLSFFFGMPFSLSLFFSFLSFFFFIFSLASCCARVARFNTEQRCCFHVVLMFSRIRLCLGIYCSIRSLSRGESIRLNGYCPWNVSTFANFMHKLIDRNN